MDCLETKPGSASCGRTVGLVLQVLHDGIALHPILAQAW